MNNATILFLILFLILLVEIIVLVSATIIDHRKKGRECDLMFAKLGFVKVSENKYGFAYEATEDNFIHVIEVHKKSRCTIMVCSYEKGINRDGFNNTVGLSYAQLQILNRKIKERKDLMR